MKRRAEQSNDNPLPEQTAGKFTWVKKQQQERQTGISEREKQDIDNQKKREVAKELEKLREKRKEREQQKYQREADNNFLSTHRSTAQLQETIEKDLEFTLQQQKHRTPIRIKQSRAEPIDFLAINLFLSEDPTLSQEFNSLGIDCSLDDPTTLISSLSLKQLNETLPHVQFFANNETIPREKAYWESLQVVMTHHITSLSKKSSLHPDVHAEITKIVQQKTTQELMSLQTQINKKLEKGGAIDVEYWETLLSCIISRIADISLLDIHQTILEKRLCQLRSEKETRLADKIYQEEELVVQSAVHGTVERYGSRKDGVREEMFITEASKMMEIDEEEFNNEEINLAATNYMWKDKYRPRKAKYFNRVQTGYEWNSYNRVHYDETNLPPKIVQGYKFNIFYPDLIDKTKAPVFTLVKDDGFPETIVILFKAGPPYEDMAFRIVNKEWEYGHKRGFKSCFDKENIFTRDKPDHSVPYTNRIWVSTDLWVDLEKEQEDHLCYVFKFTQ